MAVMAEARAVEAEQEGHTSLWEGPHWVEQDKQWVESVTTEIARRKMTLGLISCKGFHHYCVMQTILTIVSRSSAWCHLRFCGIRWCHLRYCGIRWWNFTISRSSAWCHLGYCGVWWWSWRDGGIQHTCWVISIECHLSKVHPNGARWKIKSYAKSPSIRVCDLHTVTRLRQEVLRVAVSSGSVMFWTDIPHSGQLNMTTSPFHPSITWRGSEIKVDGYRSDFSTQCE